MENKGHENEERELEKARQIKERLQSGKITPEDLKTLTNLVERTEAAAKLLRASIVE